MTVNANTVALREAERQRLEEELERFRAQGGTVAELDPRTRSVPGSLRFQLPGSIEGRPKKKWRR